MTKKWYAFRIYNTGTLYGFGTEDEAGEYCDILNQNREINVYTAHEVTESESSELHLEENTEAFNLDDEIAARKGLR
jgi:hypothetical protein